jgi:hypothetical protein
MGQFEYEVGLSSATPEDIPAIAFAFKAGEQKAVQKIKEIISSEEQLIAKTILDKDFIINLIDKEYENVEAN